MIYYIYIARTLCAPLMTSQRQKRQPFGDLSIALSVLDLGVVQIKHSTWQHRIALQLCVAHCLRSLSTLRCSVKKSLRTTNETIFRAHINLSVGNVCPNALFSADNATKAETAAVRRLNTHIHLHMTL